MDRGVRVPRGRSRATRDHAAGLTARQAEILELLAEGLTNTEIADELFVSHRTVENHVSAVLMKLDWLHAKPLWRRLGTRASSQLHDGSEWP